MKGSTLDAPPEIARRPRWKIAAAAVLVLLVGGVVAWIVFQVRNDEADARWDRLAALQAAHGGPGYGRPGYGQMSLYETEDTHIEARAEFVRRLEAFLETEAEDPALTPHVHAMIVHLEGLQVLGLKDKGTFEARSPHHERALSHLTTLIEKYPDAPINRDKFALSAQPAPTTSRMLLKMLAADRDWDKEHSLRDLEPDAAPVVVLRTTKGDLRLRFYATDAAVRVKAFLDRVCAGLYDGTAIFTKHDASKDFRLRGGDPRTSKPSPTEKDRMEWDTPGTETPLVPGLARARIRHVKGIVTSWHEGTSKDDDPVQFVLVARDSPALDYDHTPFARIDASTIAALDRIFAVRSFGEERPGLASEAGKDEFAEQLATPVVIVKALAYDEKGALLACHDASKVRPTEKSLSSLVPDEDVKPDAPPPPPAAPPTPPEAPVAPPAPPAPTDPPMNADGGR